MVLSGDSLWTEWNSGQKSAEVWQIGPLWHSFSWKWDLALCQLYESEDCWAVVAQMSALVIITICNCFLMEWFLICQSNPSQPVQRVWQPVTQNTCGLLVQINLIYEKMSQVIWSNPYLYIDLIINWQKLHSACLSSEFRWWFVFMSLSPSVDLIKLYTSKVTSASNPGGLTTQTGAIANVFSVANACFLSLSAFYTVSQLFLELGLQTVFFNHNVFIQMQWISKRQVYL